MQRRVHVLLNVVVVVVFVTIDITVLIIYYNKLSKTTFVLTRGMGKDRSQNGSKVTDV